ncbi:MAG TPA: glycerol-3-phosphate dehydrogenase [Blastocatellia bacterium]|nr:glycerol-3-phosphate dehydrogenase [Blastocatellia bacterium]
MTEFSWRTRRRSLDRLAEKVLDILVIGGGVTGAGIALDGVLRGLQVGLVEKRDFAAGTSSRSTKLIHGGLRYLEHFDWALVREGLRERATLVKIAPHLAQPFPFVIPIFKDLRRNYDRPLKLNAGLILYDLLAGTYNLGRHRRVSREEALAMAPQLDPEGLKGAYLYYDGVTDDARLVIEIIKAAHERGAQIANYARAIGLVKDEEGRVSGARIRNELTGSEFEVRARVVINATGVWMDEVIRLNETSGDQGRRSVRPSKGIHLTVPADRLKVSSAWLIPSTTDHRFYFVVPWAGRVNIGTTDTDYQGDKDSPRAENHEIDSILTAINSYFPSAHLQPSDVISSWAGLRPLISDSASTDTTDVSRKEELFESADGMISISGGKLTTYRLMAERTMDLAARRLSRRFGIETRPAHSAQVTISGGAMHSAELQSAARKLAASERLSAVTANHLVRAYGSNYLQLVELIHDNERWRERLVEGLPQILAEVVYATRNEMALQLSDLLARRMRMAMLAGPGSLNCAPAVAALMAEELGWDREETNRQIGLFTAELEREYGAVFPSTAS